MTKKSKEDIHYKKNKANKKTKSNNVSARNKNNELFDFDKEIVIGMPRISDDKEKNKKNKEIKKIENKYKTLKRINIGLSIILFISLLFNLI